MEPEITWEAVMAGCVGDASSDWGVFVIGGHTVIAPNINAAMRTTPPKQLPPSLNGSEYFPLVQGDTAKRPALGWEGQGGRPADIQAPSDEQDFIDAVRKIIDEVKGESVAAAMTAMHAQRRSDGRPVPYLPEEKL